MTSPYDWMPTRLQIGLGIALILLTILWGRYLMAQGAPLLSKLPNGIIDLEVPWSTATAQRYLELLGTEGRALARKNLELDFVFLILYPLAISLTCAVLATSVGGKAELLGVILAWAALAAMPLDATENATMLMMLSDHISAPWPQLSTICATLKFGVVAGGVGFTVFGIGAWLLSICERC